MEYRLLKIEQTGYLLIIQINRPEKMNALSTALMLELSNLLDRIDADVSIRVVIITGNEIAFAAGGDIADMHAMSATEATLGSQYVQQTFNKIGKLKQPVIAAVDGLAFGGGCELAMACDFCIASENARFAMPESKIHILPGGGGTQRLPRLAGLQNALFMLLTGEEINARHAFNIGIVQKITTSENLIIEAKKLAEKIAAKPSETISSIKKTVIDGIKVDFENALKIEANAFGKLVGGVGKAGMKAFLDKKNR